MQFIDIETGNHLWAERSDKLLTDLLDMQNEIVARLAGALNDQLVAAKLDARERYRPPIRWTSIFRVDLRLLRIEARASAFQALSSAETLLTIIARLEW
jgi:hypothetical protein